MRGIKLKHGVVFMKRDLITVRYADGKWEISKIDLDVLEWDLKTEPLDSYSEVYESDIKAMGDDVYNEMVALFDKIDNLLNGKRADKN